MRKSLLDNLLISQRPETILGRLARVVDGLLDCHSGFASKANYCGNVCR
jgi:hypothetical protein